MDFNDNLCTTVARRKGTTFTRATSRLGKDCNNRRKGTTFTRATSRLGKDCNNRKDSAARNARDLKKTAMKRLRTRSDMRNPAAFVRTSEEEDSFHEENEEKFEMLYAEEDWEDWDDWSELGDWADLDL